MVSLNRVQKLIKTMIGVSVSEATLLAYIMRLYHALEEWELQAREKILKMPCLNIDETRAEKKNFTDSCLFFCGDYSEVLP